MTKKTKRPAAARRPMPKEEDIFYVGVREPQLVRRTVLETTKECLQNLQGFEKFKSIREEKKQAIHALKEELGQLRSLMNKLRKALPKTHLRVKLHEEHERYACDHCDARFTTPSALSKHSKMHTKKKSKHHKKKIPAPSAAPTPAKPASGLERIENELGAIEEQLSRLG